MGVSDKHATTVPLVLNVSTGAITPQFHVVFDDWFATVTSESDDPPDFSSEDWKKMFGESRFQYIEDEDEVDQEIDQLNEDMKNSLKSADRTESISEQQSKVSDNEALVKEDPVQLTKEADQMNKVEVNPKVDKEFRATQEDLKDKEEAEPELISPDPLPET